MIKESIKVFKQNYAAMETITKESESARTPFNIYRKKASIIHTIPTS